VRRIDEQLANQAPAPNTCSIEPVSYPGGMLMKRVLFLCTGNYYRSRYAELLFNHLAPAAGLRWRAESRGLDLRAGAGNVGPLSMFVSERLARRGFVAADPRFPMQAQASDLIEADRIVALKEAEHRAMVLERFPDWAQAVEYWHIHDVDQARPDDALRQVDIHIDGLFATLQRQP